MGGDLDMSHPGDCERRYPEETGRQRWVAKRQVDGQMNRQTGGQRDGQKETGGEREMWVE